MDCFDFFSCFGERRFRKAFIQKSERAKPKDELTSETIISSRKSVSGDGDVEGSDLAEEEKQEGELDASKLGENEAPTYPGSPPVVVREDQSQSPPQVPFPQLKGWRGVAASEREEDDLWERGEEQNAMLTGL